MDCVSALGSDFSVTCPTLLGGFPWLWLSTCMGLSLLCIYALAHW